MAKPPRTAPAPRRGEVERVQTSVRMEKRIVLVLKALAGAHELSLGDLLEGIVLHAFEGKPAFGADSLAKIAALREVYGLDLSASRSALNRDQNAGLSGCACGRRLATASDDGAIVARTRYGAGST